MRPAGSAPGGSATPIPGLAFLLLAVLLAAVFALIELDVLGYTYERLGIGSRWLGLLLVASLAGSLVNVPIAIVPNESPVEVREIRFRGMRYRIRMPTGPAVTVVAVNVGGAVVPTAVSLWLLASGGHLIPGALAIAIVAAASYALARPVRGIGIALPVLAPPLVAASAGLLLAPGDAARLAYASGSLGTLIGADLLHLRHVRSLGAPVVAIGGAGTFDGIFLSGVLAVLLAS